MKLTWDAVLLKIDALSLRERALAFATAAVLILFLFYTIWLNPLYAEQAALRARIAQQQNQTAGMGMEIGQKLQALAADPDARNKLRLQKLKQETAQQDAALRVRQKGLLAPDRVVFLLENILQRHGKLHLLALKTLPASALGTGADDTAAPAASAIATAAPAAPAMAAHAAAPPLLFRHGVEISVQGSYPDMVAYMAALEAMPVQLFWGKASMSVDDYPRASLTLTVYTLSLDKKWMKL